MKRFIKGVGWVDTSPRTTASPKARPTVSVREEVNVFYARPKPKPARKPKAGKRKAAPKAKRKAAPKRKVAPKAKRRTAAKGRVHRNAAGRAVDARGKFIKER